MVDLATTAPCGHPGETIFAGYVRCLCGCDDCGGSGKDPLTVAFGGKSEDARKTGEFRRAATIAIAAANGNTYRIAEGQLWALANSEVKIEQISHIDTDASVVILSVANAQVTHKLFEKNQLADYFSYYEARLIS